MLLVCQLPNRRIDSACCPHKLLEASIVAFLVFDALAVGIAITSEILSSY
jgi:hypothetical protein